MMRLVGLLGSIMLYFCLATVLTQAAGLLVLWHKGHLDAGRLGHMLEVAYGFDTSAATAAKKPDAEEKQVAYEEILEKRALASLDLDLRETSLDNASSDLFNRSVRLNDDRQKYEQVLASFERSLEELRAGATDRAVQDVRQTLEAMRPEQAKEQIMLMLDDNRIDEVVTLLKSMTRDFRKKILAEFQSEDKEKLYDILEEILSGSGEGDLIDSVEEQLEQFKDS